LSPLTGSEIVKNNFDPFYVIYENSG